jgi:hypothetical protein
MTGHAFVEGRLAGGDVLRKRGRCCCGRCDDDQRAQFQFFHVMLFVGFGWLCGGLWHGAVAVDKPTKLLPGSTDLACLCGKAGMAALPMPWRSTQSRPDVLDSSSEIDQGGCAFA